MGFAGDQPGELDTGDDRGGAAAETARQWYFVVNDEIDRRQRCSFASSGERHCAINQVDGVARQSFVFFCARGGYATRFG